MSLFSPYVEHIFDEELKLVIDSQNGWLSCAIHHSIPWPHKNTGVRYLDRLYVFMGVEEKQNPSKSPCLLVKLEQKEETDTVLADVYKFLSILGWYKNGYLDVIHSTRTHTALITEAVKQSYSVSSPLPFNCNYLPIVSKETTRIALAFWREGLKLEHISHSYSFLSFFKVIESQFSKSQKRVSWMNNALNELTGDANVRKLELEKMGVDIGKTLYDEGRCAVAHASLGGKIFDPDIPKSRRAIYQNLVLIKELAKKYISEVLKVPDQMYVYQNMNYLAPLRDYLDEATVLALVEGESLPRKRVKLNGLPVGIRVWPKPCGPEFEKLQLTVLSAYDGRVEVSAKNLRNDICLLFTFDFVQGVAHVNLAGSYYCSGDNFPSTSIEYLRYFKSTLKNGIVEMVLPNGQLISFKEYVPININPIDTFNAINKDIKHFEMLL